MSEAIKPRLAVGVIGLGVMGQHHLRVLSQLPGASLVAVGDANAETRSRVAKLTSAPMYASTEELIQETALDLAIVAVPTTQHRAVASLLIEAGIPVLVEKPIAATVADAVALCELARRNHVRLGVGHIERFNPVVTSLRRALAAGELGTLFSLEATRLGPFPPRVADVGVIVDLCTHDIDVITQLHPRTVVRVHAQTHRRRHQSNEDVVTAVMRFDDSVIATLQANWLTPIQVRELTVTGERGMFLANYLKQELSLVRHRSTGEPALEVPLIEERQTIEIPIARVEPLRAELEAFLDAIAHDRPLPSSAEDGLRVLRLAEAIRLAGEGDAVLRDVERVPVA